MTHVGSIVHLTDMHLHIDSDGKDRPAPETEQVLERYLEFITMLGGKRFSETGGFVGEQLGKALDWMGRDRRVDEWAAYGRHNGHAWKALRDQLPEIVMQEKARVGDGHVIVLQSGDLQTYGVDRWGMAGGGPAYPAFEYLSNTLWPQLQAAGATTCIDLFGNHDIWDFDAPSGTPHPIDSLACFTRPWPVQIPMNAPNALIEISFWRANSVPADRTHQALAWGGLRPYPLASSTPIAQLLAVLQAPTVHQTALPHLRIVSMHHPPHYFQRGKGFFGRLADKATTGVFKGARPLADALADSGTQLVVAGHRHANDPADGTGFAAQSPLKSPTRQLVSASPTKTHKQPPIETSFAVYRLHLESADGRNELEVRRVSYRFRESEDPDRFQAAREASLGVIPLAR